MRRTVERTNNQLRSQLSTLKDDLRTSISSTILDDELEVVSKVTSVSNSSVSGGGISDVRGNHAAIVEESIGVDLSEQVGSDVFLQETKGGNSKRRTLETERSLFEISEEGSVGGLLADNELADSFSGRNISVEGVGDVGSVVVGFDLKKNISKMSLIDPKELNTYGRDTSEREVLSGGSISDSGGQSGRDSRLDVSRQGLNKIVVSDCSIMLNF